MNWPPDSDLAAELEREAGLLRRIEEVEEEREGAEEGLDLKEDEEEREALGFEL